MCPNGRMNLPLACASYTHEKNTIIYFAHTNNAIVHIGTTINFKVKILEELNEYAVGR